MKPGEIIRTGITASAIAHLSIVTLVLFFTEVHPFGSVTAEPITGDLVSPAEVTPTPKKEEPPKREPSDAFHLSSKSAAPSAPAPAAPRQASAPSVRIRIKVRVCMTPDGKLATDPILIEASASAKGPALMQSAIAAFEACQPYQMLPVDRYGEWKVLDLSFTPQDFAGAS